MGGVLTPFVKTVGTLAEPSPGNFRTLAKRKPVDVPETDINLLENTDGEFSEVLALLSVP